MHEPEQLLEELIEVLLCASGDPHYAHNLIARAERTSVGPVTIKRNGQCPSQWPKSAIAISEQHFGRLLEQPSADAGYLVVGA